MAKPWAKLKSKLLLRRSTTRRESASADRPPTTSISSSHPTPSSQSLPPRAASPLSFIQRSSPRQKPVRFASSPPYAGVDDGASAKSHQPEEPPLPDQQPPLATPSEEKPSNSSERISTAESRQPEADGDPRIADRHSQLAHSPPQPPSPPQTPSRPNGASLEPAPDRGRERPKSWEPLSTAVSVKAVAENPADTLHSTAVSFPKRPSLGSRRQSLLAPSHHHLISSLLEPNATYESDIPGISRRGTVTTAMIPRKIWVKRPGGSATLVPTTDDAVVDELRDQVIMKYANSLGKNFDAPDIVVRISPREGSNKQATPDRLLSPEESLMSVVDAYFPGGQNVEEALIIDMPQRRTPKPSPRHNVYYHHSEPGEHGDYFPLMPVNPNVPTPPTHPNNSTASVNAHSAPSISILTTGMAPPLPSPGSRAHRHPRRPPLTRHTTNSPTLLGQATGPKDTGIAPTAAPAQPAPPVPTPPGPPPPESPQNKSMTPPARVASPRSRPATKPKKNSGQSVSAGFGGGLIEGTVPPINVLIVEDNNINQRLLEAFMKRLSVRWKCAANGAEAVKKWQEGGFHLVLMDIQLPVMNGLDATKEIRRLERLNGVGVFPKTASGRSSAGSPPERDPNTLKEEDVLPDLSLFRSPVIIVALTASSLQSDRHEALAAGCNDFLTKPVRFEWLQQKVTEWGCMQALIDFQGWRKWRGFADDNQSSKSSPVIEALASPMQEGNDSRRPISSVFAASPTPAKNKVPEKPPIHPMPSDSTQDSGSGGEGLDSPSASPLTSAPADEASGEQDI